MSTGIHANGSLRSGSGWSALRFEIGESGEHFGAVRVRAYLRIDLADGAFRIDEKGVTGSDGSVRREGTVA